MAVDTKFKEANTPQKITAIIGCLLFINAWVMVLMLYLGFGKANTTSVEMKVFDTQQIFLLNTAQGLLGGALMNYKRPFISAISGMVAALGITGFTILYASWRESILTVESLFMLGIGIIPGVALYNFLNRTINKPNNQ